MTEYETGKLTELPFKDKEYEKMEMSVFPTIRREDKFGEVGNWVAVSKGEGRDKTWVGKAEIIQKDEGRFSDLPPTFLQYDTSTDSWTEAVELIQELYDNSIQSHHELAIYWLKWIHRWD